MQGYLPFACKAVCKADAVIVCAPRTAAHNGFVLNLVALLELFRVTLHAVISCTRFAILQVKFSVAF